MTEMDFNTDTRYPITVQRSMLMLPLYVVMTARIHGELNREDLVRAIEQARNRHFLLGTRVSFENDGSAFLTRDGTPGFAVDEVEASDDKHWHRVVHEQLVTPFDIDKGPLLRFSVVKSNSISQLIVCAHHVICDGISLGFLIRDILTVAGGLATTLPGLPVPPQITQETVSNPLKINIVRRWIISLIRKSWAKKNIRFDAAQHQAMLERYFQLNDQVQVATMEMSQAETTALVSRCREEKVTVNSAVWAAFQQAQHEVLPQKKIHSTAGLARSLRPGMLEDVKDSFGFFAGSMTFQLPYQPDPSFWDMVRNVHKRIRRCLDAENPFQLLIMELVHPTLADSLYFQKLGFIKASLSQKMLKLAHWHELYYGCAITNVGRLDVPESYGLLTLEAIHGPIVYSDVNEKTIGVATVANRLTVSMTSNGHLVSEKQATEILTRIKSALIKNCGANE